VFIDLKRYVVNTEQIAYIDKAEHSWTLHMSDGNAITVEISWLRDLQAWLDGGPEAVLKSR
jgi:hypothetical protein